MATVHKGEQQAVTRQPARVLGT